MVRQKKVLSLKTLLGFGTKNWLMVIKACILIFIEME